MSGPRYQPDDPQAWLSRARSNLRLASMADPEVHLEELYRQCLQIAEATLRWAEGKIGGTRSGSSPPA